MTRRTLTLLLLTLCTLAALAGPALAHGEQTQEPFVRASTVVIHDVAFSTDRLEVGEELVVTGRIRIMDAWPDHTIEAPEVGFVSLVTPGPVLTISDRQLNGEFTPQSVFIEKGAVYDFEVRARGREPGRWHIHPSFAVEGVGTLAGEGIWVEVVEGGTFVNDLELATGETVDLNSFGLARVFGWHGVSLLVGLVWLGYWLRRPLLARAAEVEEGRGRELVGSGDVRFGVSLVVVIAAVFGAGWVVADVTTDGVLLPLQVSRHRVEPLELPEPTVAAAVTQAAWRADERAMEVTVEVTNDGTDPVRLSRLQVAEFELQDHTVVTPSPTVEPGATRTMLLTIDGDQLETWNLLPLRDPQLRFTALLFFSDADGNEHVTEVDEVSAPVLPQ